MYVLYRYGGINRIRRYQHFCCSSFTLGHQSSFRNCVLLLRPFALLRYALQESIQHHNSSTTRAGTFARLQHRPISLSYSNAKRWNCQISCVLRRFLNLYCDTALRKDTYTPRGGSRNMERACAHSYLNPLDLLLFFLLPLDSDIRIFIVEVGHSYCWTGRASIGDCIDHGPHQ